jgi:hypothetical protein
MTTYYVDGAVGSDVNDGLNEGAGNAWATIDHALSNIAAGDIVYVKASVTYDEGGQLDVLGTSWSAADCIQLIGYATTPGDGGVVDWTRSASGSILNSGIAGGHYYFIANFNFYGSNTTAVFWGAGDYTIFYNCTFATSNAGFSGDNYINFIKCTGHSNTWDGFDTDSNTVHIGSKAYGNGRWGISTDNTSDVHHCLCYNNTNDDIYMFGGFNTAVHNTCDGDGGSKTCLYMNAGPRLAYGNLLYDADIGLESLEVIYNEGLVFNNLINGCTTDIGGNAGVDSHNFSRLDNVTGAPKFTDEANDDYTLAIDSPARDAGTGPL